MVILDTERQRELLLAALEGLSVSWSLKKAREMSQVQLEIVELSEALRDAVVAPLEDVTEPPR
jgi:hypothetical protein